MNEEINPYKWAQENLSPARARAFREAYRKLENSKFSQEFFAEHRKTEDIRIAFVRANLDKTNAIENEADKEASALEAQAHELLKKARELRVLARDEASKIQAEVYNDEAYKAQREKESEAWRRDHEAFKPKAQALMDKYFKAQQESEKVSA